MDNTEEEINMLRAAFKMKLKPGFEEEYKKRHDEIWPELVKVLEEAGVSDYAIYLDNETNTLFAFQKLKDHNLSAELAEKPIVKKWWAFMEEVMETNPDKSPVCISLKEVFHMD